MCSGCRGVNIARLEPITREVDGVVYTVASGASIDNHILLKAKFEEECSRGST